MTTTSNPPQDSPDLGRSGVWLGGASHQPTLDDVELVTNLASRVGQSLPEPIRMFDRSRRLFAHIHGLEQIAGGLSDGPEEPTPFWSYREQDVVEFEALSSYAAGLGGEEPAERRRLLLRHLASMDANRGTDREEQPGRVTEQSVPLDDAATRADDIYPPFLGVLAKASPNLKGRKVGVLVSSGTPADLLEALERQLLRAGARMAIVAPRGVRIRDDRGHLVPISYELSATPSVLFDAVAILTTGNGAEELARDRHARAWVLNAFHHCRVVGYSAGAEPLLVRSGIDDLGGLMLLAGERDASLFVRLAVASRSWERDGHADPFRSEARDREMPTPPPSRPAKWAS